MTGGRRRVPLRARLIFLAAVSMAPLLALIGLNVNEEFEHHRNDALRSALQLARQVALRVDEHLSNMESLLIAVSGTVGRDLANREINDEKLREIQRRLPGYFFSLSILSPDGRMLNSSTASPAERAPLNFADRGYFKEAIKRRGFASEAPILSRTSGRWVLIVAYPLVGPGGELIGVVSASTDLERFQAVLNTGPLPSGSVAALINEQGVVIGRSLEPESWVGKNLGGEPAVREVLSRRTGSGELAGPDGVVRFSGYAVLREAPWIVYVGIPSSIALAPARAALWRSGAFVAGGLTLTLFLTWWMARRLVLPIERLAADVKELAGGKLSHRSAVTSRSEVGELADQFNLMAASLEKQRAEITAGQEELLQTNRFLQAILDNAPAAIHIKDRQGRYALVNRHMVEVYKRSEEQFLGKTPYDIWPREIAEELLRTDRQVLETRKPGVFEERLPLGDETRALMMVKAPMLGAEGEPYGVCVISLDITERKRAEEELRRLTAELERRVAERTADLNERLAEIETLNRGMMNLLEDVKAEHLRAESAIQQFQAVNKELEAFAYSVSHDLKAPLRAISGFAEIIARRHRDSLNEEGQRYFANIVEASAQMGRLIDDLLAYARLGRQALKREPVRLGDLLRAAWRDLEVEAQKSQARLDIEEPLPVVAGDATLLRQLFANLLSNALAYRRPGFAPEIAVRWNAGENGTVTIEVSDNGVGIPAEHQGKIFDLFQRLHSQETHPGTGIGLAIVQKVAELHGGKVAVESEVGKGSKFSVTLAA